MIHPQITQMNADKIIVLIMGHRKYQIESTVYTKTLYSSAVICVICG